jgi:hypothetical protein
MRSSSVIFYTNMACSFIFGVLAIRLGTEENHKASSYFIMAAGTCFLSMTCMALVRGFGLLPRNFNPWVENFIYYFIMFAVFWATGAFGI